MRLVSVTLALAIVTGPAAAQEIRNTGGVRGVGGEGSGRHAAQSTEQQKVDRDKKQAAEEAYKAALESADNDALVSELAEHAYGAADTTRQAGEDSSSQDSCSAICDTDSGSTRTISSSSRSQAGSKLLAKMFCFSSPDSIRVCRCEPRRRERRSVARDVSANVLAGRSGSCRGSGRRLGRGPC